MKTKYAGRSPAAGILIALLVSTAIGLPVRAQEDTSSSSPAAIDELTSSLNDKIPAYLHEFLVPGAAVALIQEGEVVFAQGYGYSNVERGQDVTPQTGFNIGSISKTVAAWGVMKLVEDGRLALDEPVEQYLSRWRLPDSEYDASRVTVRRLLSHTAGLSLHGYPGFGPDDELPSLEGSLSGATNGSGDVRLMMEPGARWQYSGGGYTLLQLLVEEVTGRTFSDYMRDEILLPLGMRRSSYELTAEILEGSSVAYDAFGEPTPNPRFTAQAAAGLHTTVEDLATFAAASLSDNAGRRPGRGILTPETLALMTEPAPASDSSYGLGYGVDRVEEDVLLVGHGGANRGWHAVFQIEPATGDGFAVVTNGSNGWSVHGQVFCDWIGWKTGARPSCQKPVSVALAGKLKEEGLDAAVQHYLDLKERSPEAYRFNEWELNGLGYTLLGQDRVQDAIAIFRLNVQEYPEASNPYDSLGEAYMVAGENELAIENYRKSLELDPENRNAVEMLERLERE